MSRQQRDNLTRKLNLKEGQKAQFHRAVEQLPVLKVDVVDKAAHQVTIQAVRKNKGRADQKMFAPRYPKPQNEGFFLVVTDESGSKLVALKRLNWPIATQARGQDSQSRIKSTFKVPPHDGPMKLYLTVVSDGYMSMEWSVGAVEVPAMPTVSVEGDSKKQSASVE